MTKESEKHIFEHLINFSNEGIKLEEELRLKCDSINKISEEHYNKKLIESRIILISVFYDLTQIPTSQPEMNIESINKRLNLITTYIKGVAIEKDTISFGLYTKASTILKHSYEILTRIFEVKKGKEKEGINPQVRNLPENFRKFNGHLNKIAHPSNSSIIDNLLSKINFKGKTYISYLPDFSPKFSKSMFDLHILILYSIIYEKMVLIIEINGIETMKIMKERKITEYMEYVFHNLKECGIIGVK